MILHHISWAVWQKMAMITQLKHLKNMAKY